MHQTPPAADLFPLVIITLLIYNATVVIVELWNISNGTMVRVCASASV